MEGRVAKDWVTCHLKDLPDWLIFNEYLLKGHRPQLQSFKMCLRSVFRIHSETGNIWTHLIGFMATLVVLVRGAYYEKPTYLPLFFGSLCCLALSTALHTFTCYSKDLYHVLSRLDYAGIVLMQFGFSASFILHFFYEEPFMMIFFGLANALSGFVTFGFILSKNSLDASMIRLRVLTFSCQGLICISPIFYYGIILGAPGAHCLVASNFIWACFIMQLGGLIYALRVPERFFPGKFDTWFQSHQIMHIFVVFGTLLYLQAFEYFDTHGC